MSMVVRRYQRQTVLGGSNPVAARAPQTSAGNLAAGLQVVADTAAEIQDDLDIASAKESDAEFVSGLNSILYGEGGILHARGRNALDARESALSAIDRLRGESLQGLSPGARKRAEVVLRERSEGARVRIENHSARARIEYADSASEARIQTSLETAVFDLTQVGQALQTATFEVREQAARNGWAPEVTAAKLQDARDAVHLGVVQRLANADPSAALDYLAWVKDDMSGPVLAQVEARLVPIAKASLGRDLGRAVVTGTPSYVHNTSIEFSMGPKRPHAPDKPILDVIGRAAEDVFGAGARIVVTSGQEGDLPQHGSNRHKTGHAADFAIYRPDGTRVRVTDPDMVIFAEAAARRGAKGIGFGSGTDYMGDHIHVDLVMPGPGQDHVWASGGKRHRERLVAAMSGEGTPTLRDIYDEADPVIREAAFEEYRLGLAIAEGEQQRAEGVAQRAAYDFVIEGGSATELPFEVKSLIGRTEMAGLLSLERSLATGTPVQTDPQLYLELTEMASDPARRAEFLAEKPLTWLDRLDKADWEKFVALRSQIREGATVPSTSTMMSVADGALRAAGIGKSDDPARYAAFQTDLLRWAEANPDQAANQTALNEQINTMLTPIVLDAPGLRNIQRGPLFSIDFDGNSFDPNDDVTPQQLLESKLKINGVRVSAEVLEAVGTTFALRYGRDPSPQELIETLIDMGMYE